MDNTKNRAFVIKVTGGNNGVVVVPFKKKLPEPPTGQCELPLYTIVYHDKADFFAAADKTLALMPMRFWYSEFRNRLNAEPHHANTWGAYTRRMKSLGYRQTNERRKSPIKSRNSGTDYLWERITP
jgi:hypothetical protein